VNIPSVAKQSPILENSMKKNIKHHAINYYTNMFNSLGVK